MSRIVIAFGRLIGRARSSDVPPQGVVAVVLICYGVSFWSLPAAYVVGGALLIVDLLT